MYSARFARKSGDELASGTTVLDEPLPAHGKTRGKYRLESRKVARPKKEGDATTCEDVRSVRIIFDTPTPVRVYCAPYEIG